MAKLIQLPNGKYIKADAIVSVGEVWEHYDKWFFSICYRDNDGNNTFHTANLSETFVTTEDKARIKQKSFVEMVNENL